MAESGTEFHKTGGLGFCSEILWLLDTYCLSETMLPSWKRTIPLEI